LMTFAAYGSAKRKCHKKKIQFDVGKLKYLLK
jgi:hypothetical protein